MSLIVETGSGLSNAESFASVAEADTYVAAYTEDDAWLDSLDDQKERALRLATQAIEAEFASRWKGTRVSESQALSFPRADVYFDGHTLSGTSIPTSLKRATIELALRFRGDPTTKLVPDDTSPGTLVRERIKVGSIEEDLTYDSGGKGHSTLYKLVEYLLSPLTANSGTSGFVGEMVRV